MRPPAAAGAGPDPAVLAGGGGLLTGGGALLTYIQRRPNPTDFRQVLHDYAEDMLLPSLELYTEGLMADPTMYEAFLAQREAGKPIVTTTEESM